MDADGADGDPFRIADPLDRTREIVDRRSLDSSLSLGWRKQDLQEVSDCQSAAVARSVTRARWETRSLRVAIFHSPKSRERRYTQLRKMWIRGEGHHNTVSTLHKWKLLSWFTKLLKNPVGNPAGATATTK